MKKSLYDLSKQFSKKKPEGFAFRKFDGKNLEMAVNLLVYGVTVKKLTKSKNSTEKIILFLKANSMDCLKCLTIKKNKKFRKSKIRFLQINNISEHPEMKNPSLMNPENTLNVVYNSNRYNLLLEFETSEKKYLFWEAVQYFYQTPKNHFLDKYLLP